MMLARFNARGIFMRKLYAGKQLAKNLLGEVLRCLPNRVVSLCVLFLPMLRKAVPPGKEIVYRRYLGDISLSLNPIYTIEKAVLTYGYELGTIDLIRKTLSAGNVCLDIGANIGILSLAMAKSVGLDGKVYAIEPGSENYSRLVGNLNLNCQLLDIVRPFCLGLGEKDGELRWTGDLNNLGNGGFLDEEAGVWNSEGEKAQIITLDHFVKEYELECIDFIKIDVEGMEIEVLRGGSDTIKQFRPKILLETLKDFGKIRNRDILGEVKSFFDDLDYELYRVGDNALIRSENDFCMNTLALPMKES